MFSAARRTRNAQSARQTVGVRLAFDGANAPASRVPTPRSVGTVVRAATPPTATAAVLATATASRRGRVADAHAQTTGTGGDRGRPVAKVQPLGRNADVRRSSGRRALAVHVAK